MQVQRDVPVRTRDRKLSDRFIDYVLSEKGKAVYEKFGYLTDRKRAEALAPKATIGGEFKLPVDYFDRVKKFVKDK